MKNAIIGARYLLILIKAMHACIVLKARKFLYSINNPLCKEYEPRRPTRSGRESSQRRNPPPHDDDAIAIRAASPRRGVAPLASGPLCGSFLLSSLCRLLLINNYGKNVNNLARTIPVHIPVPKHLKYLSTKMLVPYRVSSFYSTQYLQTTGAGLLLHN